MDFNVTGGSAVITPVADFTISPTTMQCASSVDITITDNSIGNTSGFLEMVILTMVITRPFKLFQLLERML